MRTPLLFTMNDYMLVAYISILWAETYMHEQCYKQLSLAFFSAPVNCHCKCFYCSQIIIFCFCLLSYGWCQLEPPFSLLLLLLHQTINGCSFYSSKFVHLIFFNARIGCPDFFLVQTEVISRWVQLELEERGNFATEGTDIVSCGLSSRNRYA